MGPRLLAKTGLRSASMRWQSSRNRSSLLLKYDGAVVMCSSCQHARRSEGCQPTQLRGAPLRPGRVGETAVLLRVCERLAEAPGVNVVAVADEAGRLSGVIPVRLLLDEPFLRGGPGGVLTGPRAA